MDKKKKLILKLGIGSAKPVPTNYKSLMTNSAAMPKTPSTKPVPTNNKSLMTNSAATVKELMGSKPVPTNNKSLMTNSAAMPSMVINIDMDDKEEKKKKYKDVLKKMGK